ncbi:hypothetical protein FKG94_06325 [Exilibacterium tricleocarpae]|uniref:YcaO domain-containing protein n=1 Tax=Exilibacterium tricleocarpae TaxID=2591008 RepID=A0A545U468_9GAMM|nr:YcaO-like family protein [Exilibacterium tricleocarpae]TQV84269.1 hypothetical protein FKG94_06325 [Exilibacterium tricleocarpae]
MEELSKAWRERTHRLVPPEQTYDKIRPLLPLAGITRCADVTGLDYLGIPVYCAIRPTGTLLQVSNGKGLRHIDAQVSSLMEAIELFHAENPTGESRYTSLSDLTRDGEEVVSPRDLTGSWRHRYFSADFKLDWVRGQNLPDGKAVWLPSDAVYFSGLKSYMWTSNGLASGNHLVEATLHALYEVAERDTISRLGVDGKITMKRCQVIDTGTIDDPMILDLRLKLDQADVTLVLISVQGEIDLPTFWAILLDGNPTSFTSQVRMGYGTHLSASLAATRAITEAAQSRLTFIHGAREDLKDSASYKKADTFSGLYKYFNKMKGEVPWSTFEDKSDRDLQVDYRRVISEFTDAGFDRVYRVDLTRPPFDIPVAKVFVPETSNNHKLF